MPYSSAAKKLAREKVGRREAVENGTYRCPKCKYSFDTRSYLNKHEKLCSRRMATSVPPEPIAAEVDDAPSLAAVSVEPATSVTLEAITPPTLEVEKVIEAPIVIAGRFVKQGRTTGSAPVRGKSLGMVGFKEKKTFIGLTGRGYY